MLWRLEAPLGANIDETLTAAIIAEQGGKENHVSEAKIAVPFIASSADVEVPSKPHRRIFTTEEKKRILELTIAPWPMAVVWAPF
jgi:hypothetical protein